MEIQEGTKTCSGLYRCRACGSIHLQLCGRIRDATTCSSAWKRRYGTDIPTQWYNENEHL
ncbi:hypothetical protein DPMN_002347 [Dreissena polymorpha]|uniref:Uncharacterized protein n=1 Tax=Dreissena polymorpha TaxID=45954 RepID=A0A9D4MMN2_DREPO|nr:hypothetical protein DPMN_002347 [Dreissena polymorpha]